jgi:hypothetical protein
LCCNGQGGSEKEKRDSRTERPALHDVPRGDMRSWRGRLALNFGLTLRPGASAWNSILIVRRFLAPAIRRQNPPLLSRRYHQRICTNRSNDCVDGWGEQRLNGRKKSLRLRQTRNAVVRRIRLDSLVVASFTSRALGQRSESLGSVSHSVAVAVASGRCRCQLQLQ